METTNLFRIMDNLDHDLIKFVIQEKTNLEIAQNTGYSIGYIKRRLNYLFKLFGVKTKAGLVREMLKFDQACTR